MSKWTVKVDVHLRRTFEVEAADYTAARDAAHARMLETDLGTPDLDRVFIDGGSVVHHAPARASDYIHCVGDLVVVSAAIGKRLTQAEVDAAVAAARAFGEVETWNGVGGESLSVRFLAPVAGHPAGRGGCKYACEWLAPRVAAMQAALDAEWSAREEKDQ